MTMPAKISRPHFPVLDGLRGIAALAVVAVHLFEAHSTSAFDQIINHGYLAVDFFFLLSGYVIGYAYDDSWKQLSFIGFMKRRVTRLQPMVIAGMLIGAACFYFQAGGQWPLIGQVPVWKVIVVMLMGFFMIPAPLSMDIRGWYEMYPLNGPAWSLFFEYFVNVLYALLVRRFGNWLLTALVVFSAAVLVHYAVTNPQGDLIGGWSLEPRQLRIGFTRVMYPFFGGLLLYRLVTVSRISFGFLISSILLLLTLSLPRIGGTEHLWWNGLYESFAVVVIFPVIVYIGASSESLTGLSNRFCNFLGEISYPIYITHYPLLYIYTRWVRDNHLSIQQAIPWMIITFLSTILLAFLCLRFYDKPLRKWLQKAPAKA